MVEKDWIAEPLQVLQYLFGELPRAFDGIQQRWERVGSCCLVSSLNQSKFGHVPFGGQFAYLCPLYTEKNAANSAHRHMKYMCYMVATMIRCHFGRGSSNASSETFFDN